MKPWKWAVVVVVILAVGAAFALNSLRQHSAATKPTPVAEPAAATATVLPRLVDLGAKKCIPCKMMAPILDEMKTEYAGRLEVTFIDVWENPGAGEAYDIKSIPTQIFYGPDGKELMRHEGFFAKEDILAAWREHGIKLGTATVAAPASAAGPTAEGK